MDPFSIAAGVAGLISLTLQVSKSLKSFSSAAIHEQRDVQALLTEIQTVHSVLGELHPFLSSKNVNSIIFQHSSALETALNSCNDAVKSLQSRLDKLDAGRLARSLERLRWPFSEKEQQKVLQTLGRCTATFQFALTVEGW